MDVEGLDWSLCGHARTGILMVAKSWNAARTGFPGLRSQEGLRRFKWIEHDLHRAVAKGLLEPIDDWLTFVHREPLVGDGGSGDGAAELFKLITLVGLAAGCGVQGKTRLPGEQS